jgi:hypothetical protein
MGSPPVAAGTSPMPQHVPPDIKYVVYYGGQEPGLNNDAC